MVRHRKSCFVCSAMAQGVIITKTYDASSAEEASSLFTSEVGFNPNNIEGPFYKKKARVPRNIKPKKVEMIFGTETKKAHYKNYLVNAFMLNDPIDHAYVVIIKSLDESNKTKKQGTIIVPISELNFI